MDELATRKSKFIRRFQGRQSLRLHMLLILLMTVGAGFLATRLMLALHLKNVMVRYPLAVLFAYLAFFLSLKLWLKYLASYGPAAGGRDSSTSSVDLITTGSGSGSSGGGTGVGDAIRGGGGDFGGGGASGSFGEMPVVLAQGGAEGVSATAAEAGGGVAETAGSAAGDVASSLDFDEKGCLVLVVLGLIVAIIFGAGLYLLYAAPTILSEAAFQVILAGGLARKARQMQSGDWMGSVFKATWVPLTLTLLLSFLAGFLIHHYFPGVTRLSELWAEMLK